MLTRRRLLTDVPLAVAAAFVLKPAEARADLDAELARLEQGSGGRLGVAVLDTATGVVTGQRCDERFPMCSTFKAALTGAVLRRVDAGQESLSRRVTFSRSDLLSYSPVLEPRVAEGAVSVAELCEAVMTHSDNAAANLLLASVGGPAGYTTFIRSLGDPVTRLDRFELELNTALEGDPRDTTTPAAMASDLRALVLGDALSKSSRDQLTTWLVGNTTGDSRLRAGMPVGWRVGDKSGTGDNGTANDIAVVWPAQGAPIVITAYLTGASVSRDQQSAVLANVARAVAASLDVKSHR